MRDEFILLLAKNSLINYLYNIKIHDPRFKKLKWKVFNNFKIYEKNVKNNDLEKKKFIPEFIPHLC